MIRIRLYAFDSTTKRAWHFEASTRWAQKHNNGHMLSIGLELGRDITAKQLTSLRAVEVPYDEWNHSGCQSSCIKRGGTKCQW